MFWFWAGGWEPNIRKQQVAYRLIRAGPGPALVNNAEYHQNTATAAVPGVWCLVCAEGGGELVGMGVAGTLQNSHTSVLVTSNGTI